MLLNIALNDTEDNVRRVAMKAYKTHPYGGDLQHFFDKKLYR